jgi:hypothetical protein
MFASYCYLSPQTGYFNSWFYSVAPGECCRFLYHPFQFVILPLYHWTLYKIRASLYKYIKKDTMIARLKNCPSFFFPFVLGPPPPPTCRLTSSAFRSRLLSESEIYLHGSGGGERGGNINPYSSYLQQTNLCSTRRGCGEGL